MARFYEEKSLRLTALSEKFIGNSSRKQKRRALVGVKPKPSAHLLHIMTSHLIQLTSTRSPVDVAFLKNFMYPCEQAVLKR